MWQDLLTTTKHAWNYFHCCQLRVLSTTDVNGPTIACLASFKYRPKSYLPCEALCEAKSIETHCAALEVEAFNEDLAAILGPLSALLTVTVENVNIRSRK